MPTAVVSSHAGSASGPAERKRNFPLAEACCDVDFCRKAFLRTGTDVVFCRFRAVWISLNILKKNCDFFFANSELPMWFFVDRSVLLCFDYGFFRDFQRKISFSVFKYRMFSYFF